MSTIKSSDEHLTLNADGSSKDIKFQANGVEKASISSAGAFTSTTIDATKLTGTIPNFTSTGIDDNAAGATAITIDSSERVGIGTGSPTQQLHSYNTNAHRLRVANANYGIDLHQPAGGSSPHINAYGTDVSIILDVNDSEKMRIDSSGNVLIGKTAAGSAEGCQLESVGTAFLVRSNGPAAICGRNDSTGEVIRIVDSGTTVGTISVNGSATAYNTSSDYRLKENVDYTWDATTRLKQLKPARFNFIADDTNTPVDGFIAHEVSSVVPEAVSGEKDATETYTDNEGNEQTRIVSQGIDQSKLVPLLVKTIQELEARIAALEA